MKTKKSQLERRIKLLRIGLILNILLVLISIWQLFFESPDNFKKTTHWFVLILWTVVGILIWFQLKAVKKELIKESQIEESPLINSGVKVSIYI